ncbi:CinA family protein [Sphingomonas baiyangensis]|uniref:CinA family protein n=1 Tax=Sphingomonas baiyangensis TaxID=2572576 RepID=A0A4U1L5B9_9SPHN|nr:CinA family protein [Sphingomonas baiyangensis]TKD52141.1 CinA family protein [Sphingomonas baiyangensis]
MRDTLLPQILVDKAIEVIEANRRAGRRIATAESCTAGLVTTALTEIAGSSDVVEAGFVTYSNEAKRAILGVSGDVLETFGAVSVAVAWQMAQAALAKSGADVAVAITGIAGPGGGSEKKPVGRVVFALAERGADPKRVIADARDFENNGRGGVRLQAALCALELLLPSSELPAAVPAPAP